MWWERPHSNCTEAKANGDCDIPADSPYYQATPTGSNEPLYGRTDTKPPMVYSSMVHVAGGAEGSTRHDDEMAGPGCRGGAAPSSAEAVRGHGVAHGRTDRGRAHAPCCCDRAPGGSPGTATPAIGRSMRAQGGDQIRVLRAA